MPFARLSLSPPPQVELQGNGAVPMSSLAIGDVIRTGVSQYSEIYAFAHKDSVETGDYLQLRTASERVLEITVDHHVHRTAPYGTKEVVPARDVRVGDTLWVVESEALAPSVVVGIRTVSKVGVHAPYTREGNIVVNGILASSYDETPHVVIGGYTLLSGSAMLHLATGPLRVACAVVPSACSTDMHTHGDLVGQHP